MIESRRRIGGAAAGIVAAAVAAGIVTGVAFGAGSGHPSAHRVVGQSSTPQVAFPSVTTSPETTQTTDTTSPQLATEVAAQRLIDAIPAMPGSYPTDSGQAFGLVQPRIRVTTGNLVTRTRYWFGRGTLASAERYVETHLPPGVQATRVVSQGRDELAIWGDAGRRWQHPGVYDGMRVVATFRQRGDRVGVRMDALATWINPRHRSTSPAPVRTTTARGTAAPGGSTHRPTRHRHDSDDVWPTTPTSTPGQPEHTRSRRD